MNGYEQIIALMRQQGSKGNPSVLQFGEMTSGTTCMVGDLELEKDDLLVAEHLVTGYHKAVDGRQPSLQNENTFIEPLQKGDSVLVQRMSDEVYVIIERLVEL